MTEREEPHDGIALARWPCRDERASDEPTFEEVDAFLARLEARAASRLPLAAADAVALDALAVASARGAGAFELALGEGLDALARCGGDIRLGFSSIGDLARERLGLAAALARRLRRNAVALRSRPLLRAAVVGGDVSPRKAEVVMSAAVGADEAAWVERARHETVRRLELLVRSPEHAESDWHRIRVGLARDQAEVVEAALAAARIVLGPTAPMWKRLWAIAAEFLSTHPADPQDRTPPRGLPGDARDVAAAAALGGTPRVEAARADAGRANRGPPENAQDEPSARLDCCAVLDRLVRLVAERSAADERIGRLLLLARRLALARMLGYACFDEYCVERLGLAPSTARQRAALERRMRELPELRDALRSRRLSYEQARIVARVATPGDVRSRIDEAAGKTCIALLRETEAEEHRQMWCAGELRAVVPEDVGGLLADAIRAARLETPGLSPGEALVAIAVHFVETWAPEVLRLVKGADPVVLRDGGLCQVPGCSRPAAQVHHLWFRSAGGPLVDWNELSMCVPHHLLGVHRGSVLVTGRAPDRLTFVLGEREVAAARAKVNRLIGGNPGSLARPAPPPV
jgi:hypothetical protein